MNTLFVSYPKCGRTWVRSLIYDYFVPRVDDQYESTWTHLGFGYEESKPPKCDNNVLLVRNIPDTLVSYYHDYIKRKDFDYPGDINQFVWDNVDHITEYYHRIDQLSFDLVISYEQLIADTVGTMMPVIEMLSKNRVYIPHVTKSVQRLEFKNMHKMEGRGQLPLVDIPHKNFRKVRRGVVGSAHDELDSKTYGKVLDKLAENSVDFDRKSIYNTLY